MTETFQTRQDHNGRWFLYKDGIKVGGMGFQNDARNIPPEGFETQEEAALFIANLLHHK